MDSPLACTAAGLPYLREGDPKDGEGRDALGLVVREDLDDGVDARHLLDAADDLLSRVQDAVVVGVALVWPLKRRCILKAQYRTSSLVNNNQNPTLY